MADRQFTPRGKRAYLADFQRTLSGEFIYMGSTYRFSHEKGKSLRTYLLSLFVPTLILFASCITQGCIPDSGMMNCAYVLIPYLGELLSAGSFLWALIQISYEDKPLREYVYTRTAETLPYKSTLALVFASAAFAGELLFVLLHRESGFTLLIPALMLLSLLCTLGLRRLVKGAVWTKEQNRPVS